MNYKEMAKEEVRQLNEKIEKLELRRKFLLGLLGVSYVKGKPKGKTDTGSPVIKSKIVTREAVLQTLKKMKSATVAQIAVQLKTDRKRVNSHLSRMKAEGDAKHIPPKKWQDGGGIWKVR